MNGIRYFFSVAVCIASLYSTIRSRADIYRWDTGEVIPGTEGIEPGPGIDLSGWNGESRNLRYADFTNFPLQGSNFSDSWLDDARFSYSILAGTKFTGANLTGTWFYTATLSDAAFNNAVIAGADFSGATGFTQNQLRSTQSYQDKNLRSINLLSQDLQGWDFSGQNLIGAIFGGCVRVCVGSNLTASNFSLADLRGAVFGGANFTDANLSDTILHDGRIAGLSLTRQESLVVRNLSNTPGPIPITVQENMAMPSDGELQMRFDVDCWDSIISFEPGIPVQLGGTLGLSFTDEVDIATQIGRTIRIFDWTGVEPAGAFATSSLYPWDVSQLYTTGEVTLLLPGDTNGDEMVDLNDLNNVRNNFGGAGNGDTNNDGVVDLIDLNNVRNFFGLTAQQAVPEPSAGAAAYVTVIALGVAIARRRLAKSCPTIFIVLVALFSESSANAHQFNEMFVFGDSHSDVGNWEPLTGDTRFSNGPVWVEYLAEELGLPALSPGFITTRQHPEGGNDFAFAAAQTGEGYESAFGLQIPRVAVQVDRYLSHHQPTPNTLLVLLAGHNDFLRGDRDPAATVERLANRVRELAAGGGTEFLIGTRLHSISKVPRYIGTPDAQMYDELAAGMNELWPAEVEKLKDELGITIRQFNLEELVNEVLADPTAYGFLNVTDAAYLHPADNPDTYVYWDELHFSTAFHRLFGQRAAEVVLANEQVPGDTNGDGLVDFEDLNNVRNQFGESGNPVIGDTYPFDGTVDLEDLNAVRNNFGARPVPEPKTILQLLMATLVIAAFKLRRNCRQLPAAALLLGTMAAQAHADDGVFSLQEATVADINEALDSGVLTSEKLVQLYLDRIEAYDDAGPQLNALIAVNPTALETARALDQERRISGRRSPLHGIPVVLKDNLDTLDLPTTYGCLALEGSIPPDDAFLVRRLREAGAIILGKTNLDEFGAGLIGRSSLGGQTRDAYDVNRVPLGSSGGSGVAIAANFATLGFGADAIGSVRMPSSASALVGLKPTLGLVSRDGLIAYDVTREMAGPMARTVADVAIALDVVAGYDPADPTTTASQGHIPASYLDSLHAGSLQQARLGKVTYVAGGRTNPMRNLAEAAYRELQGLGAELTGPVDVTFMPDWYATLFDSFEYDLNRYLESVGPAAPVKSFDELVASGKYLPSLDGYFATVVRGDTSYADDPVFLQLLSQRDSLREQLIGIMDSQGLGALVYPTFPREPAPTSVEDRVWTEDYFDNMTLAAFLGLPAITVPAGFTPDGLPLGIEFLGRPFSEPELLSFAYDFEQATHHRQSPSSTPGLPGETLVLGDTNGDGLVNLEDLNNIRNNFGLASSNIVGDTNNDDIVDLVDLNNVRNFFGESASLAVPEPSGSSLVVAFAVSAFRLASAFIRSKRNCVR